MKKLTMIVSLVLVLTLILGLSLPVFAAGEEVTEAAEAAPAESAETATKEVDPKAWPAAVLMGVVAAAGAVSMAVAISKSTGSMARQPEIADKINSSMMLGLVFIETVAIYALIVAILIIFVL